MWDEKDDKYWIEKETEIEKYLVDVSEYGFVVDYIWFKEGFTDDPVCRIRKGVAEALVKAKELLPEGLNFKIYDGWRPWVFQQKCAEKAEKKIEEAHPDWTPEQVETQLWQMAPPMRIVPRFGSHRYGGAFDLTIVDKSGEEIDMGVPVDYVIGPEAKLLWYEFIEDPSNREVTVRDNRRVLARVMAAGRFHPYLEEFWHWGYLKDVEDETKNRTVTFAEE